MNRKLLVWGMALPILALSMAGARGQGYEFAVASNVVAGANLSAVANNGNTFVCVGSANTPVFTANTANFAAFQAGHLAGGYLLTSAAWTNTVNSHLKNFWLNCVAAQPNGFVASGASNAVYVSSDGVSWTNWGNALPAGNSSFSVDGISYNPSSQTFAAALAVYEAAWATNPLASNVWESASLSDESFAESFRAVTPFASSNMAMCGILGDIRISSDGGKSWNVSQQVNLNDANLLSAASDGGSNLVCAGQSSLIEVSTNGGAHWFIQTNIDAGASGSATNLSAVAYNSTLNEFLTAGAVGSDGLIMMAPENSGSANWAWARQTNLWAFRDGYLMQTNATVLSGINLDGATVATNGFFQGIFMVVGNNGAVLVGGFAPPAPLSSASLSDVTNMLSDPPSNQTLFALPIPSLNVPPSDIAVDWYSQPAGGTPIALNMSSYAPTNASCGTYTNWAAERDLRTGITSTNRTPLVFTIIPAAPTQPQSQVNCAGDGAYGMCLDAPLLVTIPVDSANPAGTIEVNWYDANTNLVMAGTSGNGYAAFTPTGLAPGIYTYYAQATNPATGLTSTNWTALTYEIKPLPQWTNSAEYYVSTLTGPSQTNPALTVVPGVTNMAVINVLSPGATNTVDWYTSGQAVVSTFSASNAIAYATETFTSTNILCGTNVYYARARLVDPGFTGCSCQSTNLIPVTFVLLPPAPIDASPLTTNIFTGSVPANAPLWVDVITNNDYSSSNFVVNWYSTAQGSNALVHLNNSSDTNLGNRFFHTPTNAVCGIYTNWAETMAIKTQSGVPMVSATRIPVVFAIVPGSPVAVGTFDETNCIEEPNPAFTVSVTAGLTANWYAEPSGTLVAAGALTYTPTNTAVGVYQYSANAVDPVSGLVSAGAVTAQLTLYSCTDSPAISFNPATGTGTIQWPGNLKLLTTTNLTPPVVWSSVSTGSMFLAPNTLSWTNTNSPVEFFRVTN